MLIDYLKSYNLSIYRVSKDTGIPYTTLHDICVEKTDIADSSTGLTERLAAYLKLTTQELLKVCKDKKQKDYSPVKVGHKEEKGQEVELFRDGEVTLEVPVSMDGETVWLNQLQMSILFDIERSVITKHINNVLKSGEISADSNVQNLHIANSDRPVKFYSLDIILSVGYRVNSARGIAFRRWANSVLKKYILDGAAINQRRLDALNKTVLLQNRIIVGAVGIESTELLRAVNEYTNALTLLDDYDHQSLKKPKGSKAFYRLTYKDCRNMIDRMSFGLSSDIFGVEREDGKVEGIIAAVYQDVFGREVYPSLEEKAANLLYFMVKDHPFVDGCKRIAASLFLEFLSRNGALYFDGGKRLSDSALVAITLMIAESMPEEKEVMTTLVMNFLND